MDLQLLGLSSYEQQAYEALVKLGKSSASQISRVSGVSYGKIYEVLATLEAKGLVIVVPEKTKMFVPDNPENLIQLLKNKEEKLQSLKKELKDLQKVYDIKEKEAVEMVKGQKNFYKVISKMKAPKKFKYTIKYTSQFRPDWARKDKALLKKGIDVRSLTRFDKETKKNIQKWLTFNKNIRVLNNHGVAVDVRDSEVMITLITKNTTISIKDDAFIDVMKQLFLQAYESARTLE